MLGSIGMPELLVIFLVALIIFGPRRLPELGKALGQTLQEFRRASSNLQRSLEEEVEAEKSSSATKPVPVAAPPGTESR
jgi:sec-independent protein translocase protein TatA